jgi:CHAT domain-containing protein
MAFRPPAVLLLALIFTIVPATGFAAAFDVPERERALVTSRYEELEKLAEAELARSATPTTPLLLNLCVAYSKLKRYDKLFPCLDRLEENIRRGDKRQRVGVDEFDRRNPLPLMSGAGQGGFGGGLAVTRQSLDGDATPFPFLMRAEAYIDLGRYADAIAQAKRADAGVPAGSDILGKASERQMRILTASMLGLAYAFSGDRDGALRQARALEGLGTDFPPYNLLRADKAMGLARIYLALKDYAKALEAIEQSRDDFFGAFDRAVVGYITGDQMKGESVWTWRELPRDFLYAKALFETGRAAEAKAGYDKLLGIPQSKDNGDLYWVLLFDRGRIAEEEGDRRQAIGLYRKAVEVIEAQRASINTEAAKIGFIGDKQAVYRKLVMALLAENDAASAFEYVERSKARALVDMLAGKQDFAAPTAKAAEVQALLARAIAAEAEGRVQGADPAIAGQRSLAVQLRRDLRVQAPEIASLVSIGVPALKELQAKLPADETLIEYYYDDRRLYAFVLTRQSLKVVPLEDGDIVASVHAFRAALDSPLKQDHLVQAQALHRWLVTPVAPHIEHPNVLIVAHGALHYLPFNALHDGRQYLLDRYRLRQLPSASVLPFLRRGAAQKGGSLLALGNPDLGDSRLDLSYAENEALAVAKLLPASRVLVRKEANLSAFRRYGDNYRYLHFASHGVFDPDKPLDSALLLSPDEQSDGRLTVSQLYSMRLDADLVTLSACETGLGKIANGDDVVGLTRGFLYAGSRSIVASLWKVDDEATAYLMTRFYSALKGTSKREALRLAQIETRKKYPHPYYWAAFQLTGEAN